MIVLVELVTQTTIFQIKSVVHSFDFLVKSSVEQATNQVAQASAPLVTAVAEAPTPQLSLNDTGNSLQFSG